MLDLAWVAACRCFEVVCRQYSREQVNVQPPIPMISAGESLVTVWNLVDVLAVLDQRRRLRPDCSMHER